ncbi:hypothetical protein [Legionella jordanis]|uniref:Uncharacterized protein n=1 Tax=Legionella jordanis TaxID=456 RepID=A0A0W0VC28_9GAMM|nr:hypothetical protein [Legionella jordanis]KTD17682.1 hypothetical protein Ljor_1988 [Legionella jordanis]RMX01554.1 hypothetical protein EAW55_10675 [Legionella jordanis]RMX21550.1 hypothetical protein EAS68_01960 [Legionella jordanis]VEH11389.1 Uncharacterised protein [Legionella jordanis]
MKPEKVLKIAQSIMANYDSSLEKALASNGNDLETLKEKIHKVAFDSAPKLASWECRNFVDGIDVIGIMAAAQTAFAKAYRHTNGIEDVENYKTEFKKAYDAALRVELYRRFIGIGLNKEALTIRFVEKNRHLPNPRELGQFMLVEIRENIKQQFKKFEAIQNSVSTMDKGTIASLKRELDTKLNNFQQRLNELMSQDEPARDNAMQEASLALQIEAGRLIREYQVKMESNSSWGPFLKNLLLLLTGIGTIPALVSVASKLKSGQYSFFDQAFLRKTPGDDMAPEDRLLNIPR